MTDTPIAATGGRCPRASRVDDRLTGLAMGPGLGLLQPACIADGSQRPAHRNGDTPMTHTPFAAAGTARHKHTTRGDDRLTGRAMGPGLGLVQPACTADGSQRLVRRNGDTPMTDTPIAATGTVRRKHASRVDDRLPDRAMKLVPGRARPVPTADRPQPRPQPHAGTEVAP